MFDGTIEKISPYFYKDRIEGSGTPIYFMTGWLDGAYTAAMVNNYLTFSNAVIEHIVGQELICSGEGTPAKQCFWVREKSQSKAEVDFLVRHGNYVIPGVNLFWPEPTPYPDLAVYWRF